MTTNPPFGAASIIPDGGYEVQPLFTQKDVELMDGAIGNVFQIQGEWGASPWDSDTDEELVALRSLRDRIKAFLP